MISRDFLRTVPRGLAGVVLVLQVGCGGGGVGIDREPDAPELPHVSPFAEVEKLEASPELTGIMVEGKAGDWVLRNDRMTVVVRGLENLGGFAYSGGNIVDAAPRGSQDLLAEVFTYFNNTFARQAVYDRLDSGDPDSVGAVLIARGRDSQYPALEVETRYTLSPGSNFLEMHSMLTNTGPDTLVDFELGDAIEWGRARAFLPGPGHDVIGYREPWPFLVGANARTTYVWQSPEGMCTGPHGGVWSDPVVKQVTLEPAEKVAYTRRLYVIRGPAQNGLRLARELEGGDVAVLQVTVHDGDRDPIPGVQIVARDTLDGAQGWGESLSDGSTTLSLPPGTYRLDIQHPHHGSMVREGIRVSAAAPAQVLVRLPDPAHLTLRVKDENGVLCPARWTLEGTNGTPDPRLNPEDTGPGRQHAWAGPVEGVVTAGPFIYTATGEGKAYLPAGSYRVTATRGPGYEAQVFTVDLDEKQTRTLEARLQRLPIPDSWVAADLHVHANPSPDCSITLEDRARSLVCEGIQWFAGSDHRRRTDYQPVLDSLDLAASLYLLPSEEVTTTTLGHFGAFPLTLHRDRPGNGAAPIHDVSVSDIFSRLREDGPQVLIQVNHPRSGANGYFDLVGDPVPPDSGAVGPSLDFDLLEIVNGKEQGSLPTVWKDWMDLLASGHRVVGVGNSDTHFLVGQEAGYPRNYVLLDSSLVPGDPEAMVDALARGRVVVSYGPFIHFTLEDQEVGSTVTARKGKIAGHIRVVAPSWVDVRRVTVYANGIEVAQFLVGESDRAIRFDEGFELPLKQSSFVMVKVEGDRSLDPVVSPLGSGGPPVLPLAFTNPIWVEVESNTR